MTPEKRTLKIGFLPLIDSAPLVAAREKGFFEKYGLDVDLQRQNSWSLIRDRLSAGVLDAAHMLAPMAPASWLNNAYSPERFVTALSLNLNGNAITVSESLYKEMVAADPDAMFERPTSARALKKVIANRLLEGRGTITIGSVFPYSSHNYAVRYWLGAQGLNPDRDVRMAVAPPQYMVEQLRDGKIDAFCAGEPWNTMAEHDGVGRAIVRSADIWTHMPEKILGVRQSWAEEFPETHMALISSVLEAIEWLKRETNRLEMVDILSREGYIGIPHKFLLPALVGKGVLSNRRSIVETPDYLLFNQYTANFPWRSHALWFLTQMVRWGQVESPVDMHAIAHGAYLPDVYRQCAERLKLPYPLVNGKTEGAEDQYFLTNEASSPMILAPGSFIDGLVFDPSKSMIYLESFLRHNLRIDLDASLLTRSPLL